MGRLNCGSSSVDHKGYWEIEGYGLLGIYKSDWIHFGGKLLYDCCFNLIVIYIVAIHVLTITIMHVVS